MPSAAAVTIFLFGVTSLGAGLQGLLFAPGPSNAATSSGSSSDASLLAHQAMTANYLAAIAMGLYYPLMAYQENRAFFVATVPMRSLSATVFWLQQWKAASLWEGAGAFLTAVALLWERGGRSNNNGGVKAQ